MQGGVTERGAADVDDARPLVLDVVRGIQLDVEIGDGLGVVFVLDVAVTVPLNGAGARAGLGVVSCRAATF